jgi:hypothetical protein
MERRLLGGSHGAKPSALMTNDPAPESHHSNYHKGKRMWCINVKESLTVAVVILTTTM